MLNTHAYELIPHGEARRICGKRRRSVNVRAEYLGLWRYAQQQKEMAQFAIGCAPDVMKRDYAEGLVIGYDLAMNALKKAYSPEEQMEWLLSSNEKRELERRMVGLPVNHDYSSGRYFAIVDVMERLEAQAVAA